jgi:hypothetical protein
MGEKVKKKNATPHLHGAISSKNLFRDYILFFHLFVKKNENLRKRNKPCTFGLKVGL